MHRHVNVGWEKKNDGTLYQTAKSVIPKDGKTRTVTLKGTDAKGTAALQPCALRTHYVPERIKFSLDTFIDNRTTASTFVFRGRCSCG